MKYLSRFSLNYPKALAYLLQASNYSVSNYISWLNRVTNFNKVEQRQTLIKTTKVKLLIFFFYLIGASMLAIVIYLFSLYIQSGRTYIIVCSFLFLNLIPYIQAYSIIPFIILGKIVIQKKNKNSLFQKAKTILKSNPSYKIAIVGSYGKTTAKEILLTVLSEGIEVLATPGNINTPIGISKFILKINNNPKVLIFELGEDKKGDIKELCELFSPNLGIITGINEAHLSSFGSLENTISTIFEIQDYLGEDLVYKNQENKLIMNQKFNNKEKLFGLTGVNGWKVSDIQIKITGMTFLLSKDDKKIRAQTALLGEHLIGIICVAVDIAVKLGLTIKQIENGISKIVPFEHRMQPIRLGGAWIIDDTYNGNSEGIKAGLNLLKTLPAKRKIFVTPGLVEQGHLTQEVHIKIGENIASVADVVILIKNSTTPDILIGLDLAGFQGDLRIIDNPLNFYDNLSQYLADGDLVLMQNDWPDNYN